MQLPSYEKRGYLNEEYRVFEIFEQGLPELNYHYHEFHKLLFLQSGSIGYSIEGRHFELKKNDLVIVPAGCVHRPEPEDNKHYSRYVLYLSNEFIKEHSTSKTDLSRCFSGSGGAVRFSGAVLERVSDILRGLENSDDNAFGSDVIRKNQILELLVILGRWFSEPRTSVEGIANDRKILEILQYINENIGEELTIDSLAERFYISKFHMMRKFRDETGYTIHSYVTNKRLLNARRLLMSGESATEVCYKCGFRDYSTFSRAYRKMFSISPGKCSKAEGNEEI